MKKVFLKYYEQVAGYHNFNNSQTSNFILQDLFFFLRAWGSRDISWIKKYGGLTWESIQLSSKDNNTLYLYNSDNIKQKADILSIPEEKKDSFDREYSQYSEKRWADMPTLEMSIQNYEEILSKSNNIIDTKPQFIIISQDDTGYVDLVGKDELSEQDLADMKIEHEKYLKYKAAYDKYVQSRPDIVDDLWHGPESSEYEADWQKFLDEPLD